MRRLALVLAATALPLSTTTAQDYSGTFTTQNAQGQTVTLILQQDPAGQVTGTISNGEFTLAISGRVEEGTVVATATGNGAQLFLEAELDEDGLFVYLMEPDVQGNPNYETGQEMVFHVGADGAAGAAVRAAPNPAVASNPLAAGANPLAAGAPDPVVGTFSNGQSRSFSRAGRDNTRGRSGPPPKRGRW